MKTTSIRVIATILGLYTAFCLSQPVSTFSKASILRTNNNVARDVKKPPTVIPLRANCADAAKFLAGGYVLIQKASPMRYGYYGKIGLCRTDILGVF